MSSIARVLLLALIAGLCVGCDRVSKGIARDELAGTPPRSLLGNTVRLQYAENEGAMLSLGADLPEPVRYWLFTGLIAVFLVVILFSVVVTERVTAGDVVAASLVVGGGTGNLIDRVLYNGVVIDFLNVGIGALRTAVFNLADVAILGGVFLFIGFHWRGNREPDDAVPVDVHSGDHDAAHRN
jgi:signal peptidase II